jgi:Histidine phosphatase superfamily (branch 1)
MLKFLFSNLLFSISFPGGESYKDLIRRLESPIIDLEQQTAPVLIVSHVSVLQALIAYFRQTPPQECMNIEIPMHTVLKFTPSRGGGWIETRHDLLPEAQSEVSLSSKTESFLKSESSLSHISMAESLSSSPIWGDYVSSSPHTARAIRQI